MYADVVASEPVAAPLDMDGAQAGSRPTAVSWEPDRAELFSTMVHNGFLLVPTLGIYRFWARTNIRRILWSFLVIDRHSLSYTGRGKELFIGFLLAILVLGPGLGLVNFLLSLMVGAGTRPVLEASAQVISLAVFAILGAMAGYFARRYLLTRTSWRGVRAGQTLPFRQYLWRHLAGFGQVLLTAGIALPVVQARLYNYRMGGTWLGTARFGADATGSGLWRAWLVTWAIAVGPAVCLLAAWVLGFTGEEMTQAESADRMEVVMLLLGIGGVGLLVALPFWLWYRLVKFRCFAAATQLDGVRFACPIALRRVWHVPLVYVVLLALTVGAAFAVAFFGIASGTQIGALGVLVALLIFFAGYNLATTLWWRVEIFKAITRHLEVRGAERLDDMINKGDPGPGRGEGMADVLGDAGF